MTGDHDALLRAVCENHRDDTPRLVYADWLEEHGQAERAAFIRTDITMSLRDEWDADRLRWEWVEKPVREVAPHVTASRPPLPEGCGWPRFPECRRGLPWAVSCERLEHLPTLAGVAGRLPVVSLVLFWRHGHPVGDLLRAPWPARVSELVLYRGGFGRADMNRLVRSPLAAGLAGVHLCDGVTANGVRELVGSPLFPRLSALSLVGIPGPRWLADVLFGPDGPAGLRRLDLTRTPVGAWPAMRTVRELSLRDVPLRAAGARALAEADQLSELVSLDLSGTHLGEGGAGLLAGGRILPRLSRLDLASNRINAGRLDRLAASPAVAGLRELHLAFNPLGNAGGAALFTSPHAAGLKVLNLSYCQVGDDALRALLEDSPLADGLVFLNLTGSPASADMKLAVKDRMGDRVCL